MPLIPARFAGVVFWLSMIVYAGLLFWLGARWERGNAAQRTVAILEQQIESARSATRELHAMALTVQAEHLASIERINAIAFDWEMSRAQQTLQFTRQRAALAALLATRPDLDGRAGADVLRHWQASNTGDGDPGDSDTSPAADSRRFDDALPGAAAGGGRPLGESDIEPRCGDGAVSPLPDATAVFDTGGADVAADGDTGVLRGVAPDECARAGGVR